MKNRKPIVDARHSERGNVALVIMIFLALSALTVMTLMAAGSFRDSRNLDKSYQKLNEKWAARSEVNKMASVIVKDAPAQLDTDVRQARSNCNLNLNLPVFDGDNPAAGHSSPAVSFNGEILQCTSAPAPTSIFGEFANWRNARLTVFKRTAVSTFNLDSQRISIVELSESYRRSINTGSSTETAYAVRYIVEAKNGNYRTRNNGEIILGSNLPGCGTSISLEAVPRTVERGKSVNFSGTYTFANSVKLIDSPGNAVAGGDLYAEQTAPQAFSYSFAPASSNTYKAVALGSGGCRAESAPIQITVTEPLPPNYDGTLDVVDCGRIRGWAADRNRLNTPISVSIYEGGTLLATVLADQSRPDVGSYVGDNGIHGFNIPFPDRLKDGQPHTISVKYGDTNINLWNSPFNSVSCVVPVPPNYEGYLDLVDCGSIQGWAADRNQLNSSITVSIYEGGTLLATIPADKSRPDVGSYLGDNGMHGFNIPFPDRLKDGQPHIISAKYANTGTNLKGSPFSSASCSAPPPPPPPPPPSCAYTAPAIQSFAATPSSIALGATSSLSWSVNGLQSGGSVSITGANGLNQTGLGASGNLTVTPPNSPGDYTYTITAKNVCPDGAQWTSTQTVIISVRACPPPSIDAFTVNPSTVVAGGNRLITFSWSVSGTVDGVSISGGVGGGLPASGTVDVNQPQTTTTYTITTVGCGVTRTAQVTVNVTSCPVPVISSFDATPTSVVVGGNQTVRLSWSLGGTVDTVNISGIGNVSGTFIDIPQPQSTTTYTLTASGCGQSTQSQVTITAASCPLPTISSFTASPSLVSQSGNQNVLFSWNVSGTIDSQSINQGIGAVSGTSQSIVQPQTTTTYTYSVTGCGQTQQAQATVTVNSPPAGSCPAGQSLSLSLATPARSQAPGESGTADYRMAITYDPVSGYITIPYLYLSGTQQPFARLGFPAPDGNYYGVFNMGRYQVSIENSSQPSRGIRFRDTVSGTVTSSQFTAGFGADEIQHFPGDPLPITFYYPDFNAAADKVSIPNGTVFINFYVRNTGNGSTYKVTYPLDPVSGFLTCK